MTQSERIRRQELEDLKSVMSSEAGRRVLNRFVVTTGIYQCSYNPNLPDSHTVFKEGSRNIGLMMVAEMQAASPGLFRKMLEEHTDEPE